VRVQIQHRSRYLYPRPALLGPQVIRLRPADHARARIETYSLSIRPEHRLHWQRDPHGNRVARVTFRAGQTTEELEILVELGVDIRPVNPFDFFIDDRTREVPFTYPDRLDAELAPYLGTDDPAYRMGRRATELLEALPRSGATIGVLVELVQAVAREVAYVIRDEPGVWTPEETLAHGRGSCRDSAVLLVALMRSRGIAARFVSGYLVQLTDEGMIPDEPRGVSRDVVDLHAWAEAYVPGAGWIGFDGTSGLLCGEGHIPLAATASPQHAAPLDGTSDVAAREVQFETAIRRLGHEARPTAPYPDPVWTELQAAGDRADAALDAAGVEVWVGGEPTFTAREHQERPEWQGAATAARCGRAASCARSARWAEPVRRSRRAEDRARPSIEPRGASASGSPPRSGSPPSCTPPTRIPGRCSATRRGCPSTSIRAPRGSTIPRSGAGSRRSSTAAPGSRSAGCCRSAAARTAGSPSDGCSAARTCSCSPATARSGCGCRSAASWAARRPSPGPTRPTCPIRGATSPPRTARAWRRRPPRGTRGRPRRGPPA